MSDSEWERYKSDIERLYCYEDKSRRQLMEYMKQIYGFDKP